MVVIKMCIIFVLQTGKAVMLIPVIFKSTNKITMKQAFSIDEITQTHIHLDNGVLIVKSHFERWIDDNDKRDWESNTSEETGSHVQMTGKMDWDQYYESNYLLSDILQYLKVRNPNTGKLKNMYDLGTGLKKLMKEIK